MEVPRQLVQVPYHAALRWIFSPVTPTGSRHSTEDDTIHKSLSVFVHPVFGACYHAQKVKAPSALTEMHHLPRD